MSEAAHFCIAPNIRDNVGWPPQARGSTGT